MKKILFSFLAFLYFICPSFAQNFYIKNYDIDIQVSSNNVYHIKENIDVYFTSPSHGIFRTIPTKNNVKRNDGTSYINTAKIKNFKATDLVSQNRAGNYIKYKMGNPNIKIAGNQSYLIEYDYILSSNSIKQNEFYFDLIGTKWDTNIDKVNFKIDMPKEFDVNSIGFSIGKYGTIGNNKEVIYNSDGFQIKGRTLRALQENEGLTIRIELPKNYFIKSKKIDMTAINCIFGVIVLTIFCTLAWYIYGKDEPIIPVVSFNPPKGMNSAQMATIYKDCVDSSCTSSFILYLASKGYLKIEEQDGMYALTKLKEYDKKDLITKSLFEELFMNSINNSTPLYRIKTSRNFQAALSKFENSLNELRKKVYDPNSISFKNYIVPLLCTLGIFIIFLFALNDYSFDFISRCSIALIFPIVAIIVICSICFSKNNELITKIITSVWALFFGGAPCAVLIAQEGVFSNFFSAPAIISLLCLVISIICSANMPRKNMVGRKILGEILGFKKFIETAQNHELEIMAKQDPNRIHEILPFAFALGVEGIWLDKISQIKNLTTPDWYSGNYDSTSFANFRTSTESTVTSSRNYGTSTSSGGSSGGGGCSGGGSGGGGGGSW